MVGGETLIPVKLIDNRIKLGLTDPEFLFLITILRYPNKYPIKNSSFKKCDKTVQTLRRSLKEKGYLEYRVMYGHDSETNSYFDEGCIYNTDNLFYKLQNMEKK